MISKHVYMAVIVPLSVIIPITVGFKKINKINKPLIIALGYLLLSGLGNLLSYLFVVRHVNNMPVLHIYTVAEFLMLSLFYRAVFENKNTINSEQTATLLHRLCIPCPNINQAVCIVPTTLFQEESLLLYGILVVALISGLLHIPILLSRRLHFQKLLSS